MIDPKGSPGRKPGDKRSHDPPVATGGFPRITRQKAASGSERTARVSLAGGLPERCV